MDRKAILIQAIHSTGDLPSALRDHADEVKVGEDRIYDDGYFRWLDTKIEKLSSSETDKVDQFKQQKAAFRPFCNVALLQGLIWADATAFNVWVDPVTTTVIYWHEWDKKKFKLTLEMINLAQKLKTLEQSKKLSDDAD